MYKSLIHVPHPFPCLSSHIHHLHFILGVEPAYSNSNAPYAETGGMGLAKRDVNGFIIEAPPLRANADKKRLEEMSDTKRNGGALPGTGGQGPPDGGPGGQGGRNIPGRAKGIYQCLPTYICLSASIYTCLPAFLF